MVSNQREFAAADSPVYFPREVDLFMENPKISAF